MDKYYLIVRQETHKYRKRLLSSLKRNGYEDIDIIRIVNGVAGRSQRGKEEISKEILRMISTGSDKQSVLSYIDRLNTDKYSYAVK